MDLTNPHFAAPGWLWLAVLGPLAFGLLCVYAARARRRQLDSIAEPLLQERLLTSHSHTRRGIKCAALAAGLGLMGVALARPQWGIDISTRDRQGEDIMVLLDCSRSMLASDVRPNRLARAKVAIQDFVSRRPGGRVGLIAFSGQAFVQCPLTFDYDAFNECLYAVDEKTIPVQGTDIARALDQAAASMESDARRKLMILVTDGEDLEREGIQKAADLAKSGVLVYAIGVGTPEGQVLEVAGQQGVQPVRDPQGQAVTSRLDEETLRAIALVTGGTYEPLGTMGQGFIRVNERIEAALDRSQQENAETRGIDRFHWFLGATLLLLVGESLIGTRRRVSDTAKTR